MTHILGRLVSSLVVVLSVGGLMACSAKVNSADAPPTGTADKRALNDSQAPLTGTVDNATWTSGKAVALVDSSGVYNITIAGSGDDISCENFMPPHMSIDFSVPNKVGAYGYDGSAGGYLVTVQFPQPLVNGSGGSDGVLSSKSMINIDTITSSTIQGRVAALSPEGIDHQYNLSGTFTAQICGAPLTPAPISASALVVNINGASAFPIAYSEALLRTDASGAQYYEVRVMNKTPQQACNTFEAWMQTESPIKYVTISTPVKAGVFPINSETTMEYGDQDATGWSTRAFGGSGVVNSVSTSSISLGVSAKDEANFNLDIEGTIIVNICPSQR